MLKLKFDSGQEALAIFISKMMRNTAARLPKECDVSSISPNPMSSHVQF